MLHFLLSVTGVLLAVSMLTGLLCGYAAQRDLLEMRTATKLGALFGILVAAGVALLEFTTAIVVREYYNLAVLCAMLLAECTLLALLAATRRLPPEKAASLPLRPAFFLVMLAWGAFYLPDIFIFPSHFAVGVVQVASSDFVFIVTGYLIGLILCILVGYSTFRVCAVVPEKILFPFFTLAYLAFALTQTITVGQTLLGRGLMPRYDWALDLIIFLLDNASLLLYLLTGLTAAIAICLWIRSASTPSGGYNPALRRKAKSHMRLRIRWSKASLSFLICGLLVMTVGMYFNNKKVELSPAIEMAGVDGQISHATAVVGDGKLHRFVYKSKKGVDIRYIIIKKSETAYGVGLDACDVCGPSGYYERKGQVICILCDVVMNKATIGFAGGCNPVPLKFSLKDGNLVINTADLDAEAPRFM